MVEMIKVHVYVKIDCLLDLMRGQAVVGYLDKPGENYVEISVPAECIEIDHLSVDDKYLIILPLR